MRAYIINITWFLAEEKYILPVSRSVSVMSAMTILLSVCFELNHISGLGTNLAASKQFIIVA